MSLHASMQLQARIAELQRAAAKASQVVRQVELNIAIGQLRSKLVQAKEAL